MLRRRESPRTCIRLPLRNSRGPFRFESGTGTRNRREPDGRPTTAPSRPTHTRLHSYTYAQLPEPVHTRTPALVHEHAPKPSSPESGICQRKGDSSLVNGPAARYVPQPGRTRPRWGRPAVTSGRLRKGGGPTAWLLPPPRGTAGAAAWLEILTAVPRRASSTPQPLPSPPR